MGFDMNLLITLQARIEELLATVEHTNMLVDAYQVAMEDFYVQKGELNFSKRLGKPWWALVGCFNSTSN